MSEIMYQKSYQEYKAELDGELQKTAEGFVRIGYLLKLARDTNILAESPYSNVVDFAKAEYGLDKTQVSRFIHINDRFSEDGYSDRLQERYRGFGHAKLTIMLQLPDSINEEITPEYSKAEIQSIKDEVDSEKKITDIEVALEGEEESMAVLDDNLSKAIQQLGQDEPEMFVELHHTARTEGWNIDTVKSIMAPSGEKIYSIRIRGIGRMMLSLKDNEHDVALIDVRQNEKSIYSWEDILANWQRLIDTSQENAQKEWESMYGLDFRKKAEVAPVQQQKEEKKQPTKKETKVSKAKTEEKPKKKEPEKMVGKTEEKSGLAAVDEQLPGQTSIEKDFPEYLPDEAEDVGKMAANTEMADSAELTEAAVEAEERTAVPQMSKEEAEKHRERYKELLDEEITSLRYRVDIGAYEAAKKSICRINKFIDRLADLPQEEDDEE